MNFLSNITNFETPDFYPLAYQNFLEKSVTPFTQLFENVTHIFIEKISGLPKNCFLSLSLGFMATLLTKNYFLFTAASLNCIPRVDASKKPINTHTIQRNRILEQNRQRRAEAGVKERQKPSTRKEIQSLPDQPKDFMDSITQLKIDILSELAKVIPEGIRVFFRELSDSNWLDALLGGLKDFVLSYTQIDVPARQLEDTIAQMEEWYWLETVKPLYVKIFQKPAIAWDRYGNLDSSYEINQMRSKLRDYNYLPIAHGTPLQFLESLQNRGICDGGSCRWN